MISIATLVTTYNRLELLKECLNALLSQTVNCDIIIVDNASTDGTKEYLKSIINERILYYNTGSNLGGAGGFAYGMRIALERGYDFVWIMDDDSIAEADALEKLVTYGNQIHNNFSFLASLVLWNDHTIIPMNFPSLKEGRVKNKDEYIKNHVLERDIQVNFSSFVGCYINCESAFRTALPIADFFIYGDDVEYTQRLSKICNAYFVTDSIIIHKTVSKFGANIVFVDEKSLWRYYYQYRNGIYIAKENEILFTRILVCVKHIVLIIVKSPNYKIRRILTLLKGTISGFLFKPEKEYVEK